MEFMKNIIFILAIGVFFILPISGCGDSEIGEPCDTAGVTEGCEEGAICGNIAGGTNYCQLSCTVQADCAATENCTGITGTDQKSCQAL